VHFSDQEKIFMKTAMQLAQESYNLGEVPVGAIVVKNNEIIGRGRNTVISDNDVTAHAEINAIREASKMIGNYRLVDCSMFVTLEPCHMCAKAIVDARFNSIIFAAKEPKTGSIFSIDNFFEKKVLNHKVNYKFGLFEEDSSNLLKDFFKQRR
jgi:tRNA(adenine34) deaminase